MDVFKIAEYSNNRPLTCVTYKIFQVSMFFCFFFFWGGVNQLKDIIKGLKPYYWGGRVMSWFTFTIVLTLYLLCQFQALPMQQQIQIWCQKYWQMGIQFSDSVENIVGKEEIACYKQFLLFPQCFQTLSVGDALEWVSMEYRFKEEWFYACLNWVQKLSSNQQKHVNFLLALF